MNRQQAKELLPIIKAFAEGKTIQIKAVNNRWYDRAEKECEIHFNSEPQKYRIKPESKYRPFANREECWQEMLKHQPFGWVKTYHGQFVITEIRDGKAIIGLIGLNDRLLDFDYIFKEYTFADGTPFGIKE